MSSSNVKRSSTSRPTSRRSRAVAAVGLAAGCADVGEQAPIDSESEPSRISVVLDYSPTISDIGALFYLASHPDVDLLAVTLPERRESDCDVGIDHTLWLLSIAGQTDVPVGCGIEAPLVGDRDWPDQFREFSNLLAGVELPVVLPGASVDVPGNVEAAPTAEWNLYIDPEAARLVLASGVDVLLVPLDATNDVPWTDTLGAKLALLDSAVGRTERQVVASRGFTDGISLWDELAAVATLHPEMLQIERRSIVVDDDGATLDGPSGVSVDVAVGADSDSATTEFMRILNGGVLPDIAVGTPEEHAYFDQLEAGFTEFTETGRGYAPDLEGDAKVEADRFIVVVTEAFEELSSVVDSADPPASLEVAHADLSEAITAIAGEMDNLRTAVAAAEGGRRVHADRDRDRANRIGPVFR